jgi:predicted Zn-dependent protease
MSAEELPGVGRLVPAHELVERGLAAARGPAIVMVEEGTSADIRFANNTTTTNGVRRVRSVSVACFSGDGPGAAVGVASGSGPVDVVELVRRAEVDAASSPPAEDAAALIGPAQSAPSADFTAPPAETTAAVLAPLLGDLGAAFARGRAEGHVVAGFATHEVGTLYLGSSTGVRLRHVDPSGTLELVARSADGERSAWTGVATEDFSDCSLAQMEDRLLGRLGWARRRVELPAGRYETVLPPDAVADLMIVLSQATSGREAEEGGSVFSARGGATRVGERLSPLAFTLVSDPAAPGLAARPFLATPVSGVDVSVFDNGAPLAPTAWIDDGHLRRLRYHRAGAERSGALFTPPIDNLRLELPGASAGLDELVRGTERGLLLTCLWYIREVDLATLLLTGLTRDGVYLVEHGEVVGAVNNFRFNESPVDLLARASEAGESVRALSREWGEWMRRSAMPALRIPDFNMSSVSPAS